MNIQSIKDRLRNEAIASNKTIQEAYVYYGLERTLYRISTSQYANHFILKGGIFLYAIFNKEYLRTTVDIDLLANKITNKSEKMKEIFLDIFRIQNDDGLIFDLDSLNITNITEFKEYHGLNIKITAYLDKTQIPISIDIGYGDIVFPNPVTIEFPTLIDNDIPKIQAYSIESAIAEKLETIVSNGFNNSRYKDFYDIYILSNNCSINKKILQEAIIETFKNRKTPLDKMIEAFEPEFYNNQTHITRWNSFAKKKKITNNLTLKEITQYIEREYKSLINKNI